MKQNETKITVTTTQRYQKKYRKRQSNKGFTRYELQVHESAKVRFEQLVEAAAEEFVEPEGLRQRMAKARAQMFDEITKGVCHEFFTLKDQIKALQEEITALSPSFFFESDQVKKTPVPTAVAALPNDPEALKAVVANLYRKLQSSLQTAKEYERRAKQYLELYEASSGQLERLRQVSGINDSISEDDFDSEI